MKTSFRFRRSLTLFPGLRLNFGKTGLTSISTGGRGYGVTYGRKGARIRAGIPGTGLSVQGYQRYGEEFNDSTSGDGYDEYGSESSGNTENNNFYNNANHISRGVFRMDDSVVQKGWWDKFMGLIGLE